MRFRNCVGGTGVLAVVVLLMGRPMMVAMAEGLEEVAAPIEPLEALEEAPDVVNAPILTNAAARLSFQMLLTDGVGDPLPDGNHTLDFFFYGQEVGGAILAMRENIAVTTLNGVANTLVQGDPNLFQGLPRWVGITVDDDDDDPTGDELAPRIPLVTVPYAFRVNLVDSEELTDHVRLGNDTATGSMRVYGGLTEPSIVVDGPTSRIDLVDTATNPTNVGVSIDGRLQWVLVNGNDGEVDAWLRSVSFGPVSYGQLNLYDADQNTETVELSGGLNSGGVLTLSDSIGRIRSELSGPQEGGLLGLYDRLENLNLRANGDEAQIDALRTNLHLNRNSETSVIAVTGGGRFGIGTDEPEQLLHLSSLSGIDLLIDADTNNVGEDQNARIVLRQDGGAVVSRIGYRDGENNLEIMQESGNSLFLGSGNTDHVTVTPGGLVGIGTTTPNQELVIQGDDPALQIRDDVSDNSENAARLELLERDGGTFDGGAFFWWNGASNKLFIGTKVNGTNTNVLVVDRATSSVGIGTQTPGNYRLAVNGPVRAKEIVVDTGWSDFVFEDDYDLPTLEDVEAHIKTHRRLKDIPSAAEVAKHGVKVGEMESKLLQKVEEMTLHLIDLNNRVKSLEAENTRLRATAATSSNAKGGE